jgi:hypothetical protein
MSYKYRVLSDSPSGYWPLEHFVSPDISGGANALVVNDFSNTTIKNIYGAFTKGNEQGIFGIEFWASKNKSVYLSLKDSDKELMNIYFDNDIVFSVTSEDKTKYITKKSTSGGDLKEHIFALYTQGHIQLFINGVSDGPYKLPESFKFSPNINQMFNVGSNISDLAFYARCLSLNEIRGHMSWATKDLNSVPEDKDLIDQLVASSGSDLPFNKYVLANQLFNDDKIGIFK